LTRRVVLAAAAIAFVNAVFVTPASQIIDDAFIFFRYADNALAGHGLTWNPGGERVEGFTSVLYMLVVVALRALRLEPVMAANAFNVTCFVLLVATTVPLLRAIGKSRTALLVGPILVAAHTYFAQLARGGMEQMLFLLLMATSLLAFFRAEKKLAVLGSGALFALAALTRPESMLDWIACAAFALWTTRDWKREAIRAAGLALVLVPQIAWRHSYYGEWLPNTYYAKVGVETWAQFSRGLVAAAFFFASSRGALVILSIACTLVAPRNRERTFLVVLMGVWLAWLVSLGLQDWNYYYSVPVDLLALVVLASSLGDLLEARAQRSLVLLIAVALIAAGNTWLYVRGDGPRLALLLVAIAVLVVLNRKPERGIAAIAAMGVVASAWWQEPHQRYDVVTNNVAIGKKLAEIAKPGETLAIGAVGAIPYYSGLVTYDTLGLNDKHIARVPVKDPAHLGFGHERGDGAYILSKKPTYLLPTPLRSDVPGDAPWWRWVDQSFTEMFATEEFKRDYHFEEVEMPGGGFFKYYKRSEAPR
jgi:arabinofuranosyltransferase